MTSMKYGAIYMDQRDGGIVMALVPPMNDRLYFCNLEDGMTFTLPYSSQEESYYAELADSFADYISSVVDEFCAGYTKEDVVPVLDNWYEED